MSLKFRVRGRLLSALVLIFVVALGSSQMVRPAHAFSISSSSFAGITYINEHFRMEIGPQYATLYDPYVGNVLVQRVYWSVQVMSQPPPVPWSNGTVAPIISPPAWVTMNWTSGPSVQQLQLGTYHRVVVSGILSNQLGVMVFFDGNSTGSPASGPKISVVLQSVAGWGVFRVQWRLEV